MKQDKNVGLKRDIAGNEDLYRVLFESVHDGIYRSTIDGRILTANPALIKMLGYETEEELRRLNIGKDIYVKEDVRNDFVREINRSGRLKDTELVLKKKDGSHIIVLENSHAVYGQDGVFLYYEGTLTEVTDRKKAEQALRESEDRYHTLLETLQDGLSLFDLTGKLIYYNNRKKKMLGYDNDEELLKVNTFDMIHPDDRNLSRKISGELIAKGSVLNKELRVLRKDGTWFWAEFSANVLRNSEGAPTHIMDSMRDITGRKEADEQLMILKHSIDVHYDGAYWMDNESRFIYVNDAACRETGYKRKEIIGKHVSFINPEATDEIMKLIWDKLRKYGSFTSEATHRRKDGTTYPVETVITYIKFAGREYNCGFARNITERKRAAEELKLRVEQLRQIIDLVPSYIFAKDIDGKFILVNKALAEVFGLAPEEIQGKDDSDYGATREQIRWYRKYDLEVIKKGIPVDIPEEQVLRKDGSLGWFQTVKIPYRHPGYDKPAILGVATEITERKKAEDELRSSERRFRKLFELHSAVKLLIDPNTGAIVDANKSACEFYGWPSSKLRRMSIFDLNTSPADLVAKRMQEALAMSSIHFETTHRTATGMILDVEVFSSSIEIEGNILLHSIIHDISEKKKILKDLTAAKEKAEESDRLKTAFLHNISHEIRTPMNAIVGFTSLLDSKEISEDTRKQYLDIILQSSNQLLSIISDIVDISNLATGHARVIPVKTNINSIIISVTDQYMLEAGQKGLKLTAEIPLRNSEAQIMADETKINQVLSNLVDNAVKFTEKGSITTGYNIKGKSVVFYVRDTGIGIRPGYLPMIFDRFYQVESPATQKTEGTGLGLSICKGYVELMGGKIHVESEYGIGSSFFFSIPYRKVLKESVKGKKPHKPGKK